MPGVGSRFRLDQQERALKLFRTLTAAGAIAAATIAPALAVDISGAGATFPYPIYAKWADAYKKASGNGLNYQSIGSGGGIKQIKAKTVTFGASDAPLPGKELDEVGLAQFPMVMGGIVPVVNLDGIKPGDLVIDGPTLARIFMGDIKTWDDPALKKLNPNANLPKQAIAVVHRSDGSGTTFNFVNYLSKVNGEWKTKVGEGTSVKWPTGIGGKGNEGVAAYVKQINGGIGYVELSYALQNKMAYARLKNAAGNYVLPSDETFSAAAASADWTNAKDFYLVMTNAPGENSWPITATNFILMYRQPKNANSAKAAKDFFRWVYANGDAQAKALDYVPLPPALVKQIEAYWSQNMPY